MGCTVADLDLLGLLDCGTQAPHTDEVCRDMQGLSWTILLCAAEVTCRPSTEMERMLPNCVYLSSCLGIQDFCMPLASRPLPFPAGCSTEPHTQELTEQIPEDAVGVDAAN